MKNIYFLLVFSWSVALLASSPKKLSGLPPKFEVLDVTPEGFLLGKNQKGDVVVWNPGDGVSHFLSTNSDIVSQSIFHSKQSWFSYVETQKENLNQRLIVLDYKTDTEIFRSTPFQLFLFARWIDACRIVVGTTEADPIKLYQFKIDPLCSTRNPLPKKSSLFTLFSSGQGTNWAVDQALNVKPWQSKGLGQVYDTQKLPNENLVFTTDSGGIFVVDSVSQKVLLKMDRGFRPKVHFKRNWVSFEIPGEGRRIWDVETNRVSQIFDPATRVFFWEDSRLLTFKGVVPSESLLEWSKP